MRQQDTTCTEVESLFTLFVRIVWEDEDTRLSDVAALKLAVDCLLAVQCPCRVVSANHGPLLADVSDGSVRQNRNKLKCKREVEVGREGDVRDRKDR